MNTKIISALVASGLVIILAGTFLFSREQAAEAKSQPTQSSCSAKKDCPFKNVTTSTDTGTRNTL